jgi:CelD/BcsL family acetyltransferase involved in cellulose biosynthesis
MIEIVEQISTFSGLRAEWDDLLHASGSNTLFLTWEWLYTWWKHLAHGRRLKIFIGRLGGELIMIAPLCLRPPQWSRLSPLPSMEFLGMGGVGSDYLDFIVREGREAESFRALAEHFGRGRHPLELDRIQVGTAATAMLVESLEERGWQRLSRETETCPYISLTGHSWESYLATLGSSHRYNFRRRLKNLEKSFAVRFDQAGSEGERRESLDVLIRLHGRRWEGKGQQGAFYSPDLVGFHDELSRLALNRGWLRLFLLRLDEKPVAAIYGFRYGPVFYFYQSGFDPEYEKQSVGLVAMGLAIQSAIEEGAEEYDLLHGDEPYKFLWTRRARPLRRIELYPACAYGAFCRRVAEWSRRSRRAGRRLLGDALADRIAARE